MEHIKKPEDPVQNIAIIGVGMIGGSMAARIRAIGRHNKIIGVDSNTSHGQIALSRKLVDAMESLPDAIAMADLVILATPVDSMLQLLPEILDYVTTQVIMDTGSTKKQICDTVTEHPLRNRYVASHPMWGSEQHGPLEARAESFENKVAVICEADKSDPDALHTVMKLYRTLGMRIIEMEPEVHDIHTAYISHLPHVISYALANTVLIKEREKDSILTLASGGFNSTARLAKSSSQVWTPVFNQNRDNVLFVLDEYIEELRKFRNCLEGRSYDGITSFIEHANFIKKVF
jgi:prephenate dehydrogenase